MQLHVAALQRGETGAVGLRGGLTGAANRVWYEAVPRRSSRPPPPHAHGAGARGVPPPRPSSSVVSGAVTTEAVAAVLAPLVPDAEDLDFVARCLAAEGPMHHRLASFALLKLLRLALDAAGGPGAPPSDMVPVPLRLPPHLGRHGDADAHYPLSIPRRALDRLAPPGSHEAAVLANALMDGPPHHALANAAMVGLLDALLARLASSEPR